MSEAVIFCAKCGAAGQRPGSYCRSCGEWLADPAATGLRGSPLRGLSPERRRRRVHTLQLLSALAAAAAAAVTIAVRTGNARPDLLILTILLCLVVVAWQGVAFFIGRGAQGRRGRESDGVVPPLQAARGGSRAALGAADTGDLVRPPSVTENTTALLESAPAKKMKK